MKHLYFVRHGLSEANKAGLWSGGIYDTPLAAEGIEQAKMAGAKAAKDGLEFDLIVSSPMVRTSETAKYIASAINYPIDKIVYMESLRERTFGILEGQINKEVGELYWKDESYVDKFEGAERLVDMQWRANNLLKELKSLPQDKILIVGHSAFTRTLRRSIEGIPLNVTVEPYPNAEIVKLI